MRPSVWLRSSTSGCVARCCRGCPCWCRCCSCVRLRRVAQAVAGRPGRRLPARWRPRRAGAVGIVVRDRTAYPLPGRYNVCYVNGFQTQADERRVLEEADGPGAAHAVVARSSTRPGASGCSTSVRRASGQRLARIVGAGPAAVPPGLRRRRVRQPRLLHAQSRAAHAESGRRLRAAARAGGPRAGLAAGQKNLAGLQRPPGRLRLRGGRGVRSLPRVRDYVAHYGRRVLAIEYRRVDFRLDLRPLRRACPSSCATAR